MFIFIIIYYLTSVSNFLYNNIVKTIIPIPFLGLPSYKYEYDKKEKSYEILQLLVSNRIGKYL